MKFIFSKKGLEQLNISLKLLVQSIEYSFVPVAPADLVMITPAVNVTPTCITMAFYALAPLTIPMSISNFFNF